MQVLYENILYFLDYRLRDNDLGGARKMTSARENDIEAQK